MKLIKGDKVQLMLGKDAGKTGQVLRVFSKEGKVLVEGANMVKRHVKRMQGMEGGIVDVIKPVNISNVMMVCPNCEKLTRVGFEMKEGKKTRICKKCKKEITTVNKGKK